MQISTVIDQRRWFRVGDTDDCWVASALMLVHATLPWLRLVSTTEFRKAAGDPDDGIRDGGNNAEIVKGIEGSWPVLRGKMRRLDKATWAVFRAALLQGRPVTVAVKSNLLPARMRFGFDGYHQVVVAPVSGGVRLANPLAPAYSRWEPLTSLDEIKDAILEYGKDKGGERSVYAVVGLTDEEGLALHPDFAKVATAQSQALIDAAVKDTKAQLVATKAALDARTAALRAISAEAAHAAETPPTP